MGIDKSVKLNLDINININILIICEMQVDREIYLNCRDQIETKLTLERLRAYLGLLKFMELVIINRSIFEMLNIIMV